MNRTWGESQAGGQPPGAAPAAEPVLRGQLAGLRHRAAIRKQKVASQEATSSCEEEEEEEAVEQEGGPSGAGAQQGQAEAQWFAAADEGPSDSADATCLEAPAGKQGKQQQQQPYKRRFVADSQAVDAVKDQLQGMRRRAMLKRRGVHEQPA